MTILAPKHLLLFGETNGTGITNYGTTGSPYTIQNGAQNTDWSWHPGLGLFVPGGYLQTVHTQTTETYATTAATAPSATLETINFAAAFRCTAFDSAAGGGVFCNPTGGLGAREGNLSLEVRNPSAGSDFDLNVLFTSSGSTSVTQVFTGLTFGTDYQVAGTVDVSAPAAVLLHVALNGGSVQTPASGNMNTFNWEGAWPMIGGINGLLGTNWGLVGRFYYWIYDRGGATQWSNPDLLAINANPTIVPGWPGLPAPPLMGQTWL